MKVGIFGGTFDPIHNDHIGIVKAMISTLGVDKVLVMPTANPPHKRGMTDYLRREAMVSLALEGIAEVEVSNLETTLPPPNYTLHTLRHLKSRSEDEYIFVIGEDSMADIYRWYRPLDIFPLATICVVGRSNRSEDASVAIDRARSDGAHIVRLDYSGGYVSSSLIRGAVEVGEPIDEYMPKVVADYVYEHGLYHDYADIVTSVRERVGDKRFRHTAGVVTTALRLNAQIGLPYEKVLLATLLHDVDKYDVAEDIVPKDAVGTEVAHQFSGAYTAREVYRVDDEDILNAIRYHTTGRGGQSELERLVYLADMIEPSRVYPEVDALRDIAYADVEEGYRRAVRESYAFLLNKGVTIHPLTIQALEDIDGD